jgi:hypothetical protein
MDQLIMSLQKAYDHKVRNLIEDRNNSDNELFKDIIIKSINETEVSLNFLWKLRDRIKICQNKISEMQSEIDQIDKKYMENQDSLKKILLDGNKKISIHINDPYLESLREIRKTIYQFNLIALLNLDNTFEILVARFIDEILMPDLDAISPEIIKQIISKTLDQIGIGPLSANDLLGILEIDKIRVSAIKKCNEIMNHYCNYLEAVVLWREMIQHIDDNLSEIKFEYIER